MHNPTKNYIDDYLQILSTERRLASLTLASYQHQLNFLRNFLSPRLPETASSADIRQCVVTLHGQGLDGRSIAHALSVWRGFFRWLANRSVISINPTQGIRAPKSTQRLPKALSVDTCQQLMDNKTVISESLFLQLRDQAMLEILYSCGLRVSELVNLDMTSVASSYIQQLVETNLIKSDVSEAEILKLENSKGWINLADQEVFVVGKGGKGRTVAIGGAALNALNQWLSARQNFLSGKRVLESNQKLDGACAVFISSRGERLTIRSVQLRVKKLAKMRHMPSDVHPHVLRHSFASHILQSSSDLRATQELLGHAHIKTTQIYTRLDYQHLAQAYDLAHPKSKKET